MESIISKTPNVKFGTAFYCPSSNSDEPHLANYEPKKNKLECKQCNYSKTPDLLKNNTNLV